MQEFFRYGAIIYYIKKDQNNSENFENVKRFFMASYHDSFEMKDEKFNEEIKKKVDKYLAEHDVSQTVLSLITELTEYQFVDKRN